MRITIVQADGVVGIDGDFRKVDLSALDPAIHGVQFDTERATGKIEFDPLAKEEVDARDLDAEAAQERPLREKLEQTERDLVDATRTKHKQAMRALTDKAEALRSQLNALQPIMRKQPVPRKHVVLNPSSFATYQSYVDAWRAAKPMQGDAP